LIKSLDRKVLYSLLATAYSELDSVLRRQFTSGCRVILIFRPDRSRLEKPPAEDHLLGSDLVYIMATFNWQCESCSRIFD